MDVVLVVEGEDSAEIVGSDGVDEEAREGIVAAGDSIAIVETVETAASEASVARADTVGAAVDVAGDGYRGRGRGGGQDGGAQSQS